MHTYKDTDTHAFKANRVHLISHVYPLFLPLVTDKDNLPKAFQSFITHGIVDHSDRRDFGIKTAHAAPLFPDGASDWTRPSRLRTNCAKFIGRGSLSTFGGKGRPERSCIRTRVVFLPFFLQSFSLIKNERSLTSCHLRKEWILTSGAEFSLLKA